MKKATSHAQNHKEGNYGSSDGKIKTKIATAKYLNTHTYAVHCTGDAGSFCVYIFYFALQFVMKWNSDVKRVACVSINIIFVMAMVTAQTPVMRRLRNVVRTSFGEIIMCPVCHLCRFVSCIVFWSSEQIKWAVVICSIMCYSHIYSYIMT